jgi:polysaccharide pyruvyl transferase WcaK-like protein
VNNKILFCGPGYGAGNIGDDAILAGALTLARKYLSKDTQYGAIVYQSYFTKERADTDKVFPFLYCNEDFSFYNKEIDDAFNWATHIVFGGATLIGDWGIPRCARLIKLAHKLNKPVCMLGVGVTNRPSKKQLQLLRETFGSLDLITVRSEKDKEVAISYGLSSEKIKVCADLAFAIDCKNISYDSKNTFGINLVSDEVSKKHPHVENLRRFLIKNKLDMSLSFICGEARKDSCFDYDILFNFHKQLGGTFVCEHFNYLDFLKLLTTCRVILTMRMHMTIFCALVGVPCIPLVRERKTKLMADSLGFSCILSLDEDFNDMASLISSVLKHPKKALVDVNKVKMMKKKALDCNGLLLQKWINTT